MKIRSSSFGSIIDARAKITEMAEDVMKDSHEKVLTKNSSSLEKNLQRGKKFQRTN